ncbi:hypothetical protein NJ76_32155, partial [Rhodococcus sp. IITR03]
SVLSARATRRRDVVISLPTTARGTRELRTVPAMVASVLPLRFDVPDDARLADVAEVIDGKLLGLLKHGRYRGEDLGRELAEIDPDWRPPTVGVNIMPAAASRYSVGRESQAHMLSSGPVGELEFILVLEKAGHPIEIGLRGHADDAPLAQRCPPISTTSSPRSSTTSTRRSAPSTSPRHRRSPRAPSRSDRRCRRARRHHCGAARAHAGHRATPRRRSFSGCRPARIPHPGSGGSHRGRRGRRRRRRGRAPPGAADDSHRTGPRCGCCSVN